MDLGPAFAAEDAAQSCSTNSFTGKTRVLLADGKTIPIAKVKAGDKVTATDPYQKVTAARPVGKVIRHYRWHAMAAGVLIGGAVIQATSQHPIWDATTRQFTYAASLRPGDKLLEPNDKTVTVKSVRSYQADLTAYNLDVSGIHTYYVQAGTTPSWSTTAAARPPQERTRSLLPRARAMVLWLEAPIRRQVFHSTYYSGPTLTSEMVRAAEAKLGRRLPKSYVELLRLKNGGRPVRRCIRTPFRTSWAENHIEINAVRGIGGAWGIDTDGPLSSTALIAEWGYPDIGIVICDMPSGGHDTVMLDYSDAENEPSVVYVDEDRKPRTIAKSFSEFLNLLLRCEEVR